MKNLRTLCAVVVLTFALMTPAFAGQISTGIAAPPPPPETSSAVTDGQISTGITDQGNTGGDAATANNSITEITLYLLQSVLSLF